MSKIVFVVPPNSSEVYNNFTCGVFSLGSILANKNYDVRIISIDYLITAKILTKSDDFDENIKIFGDYIIDTQPDIISFYTMSNSYFLSVFISKYIKEKQPHIKIAFGGPQATLTAEKTLQLFDWIDCIGLGEGEKSIEKITFNLLNNIPFSDEKGVAYRKYNKIIQNEIDLIENLDETPKYNFKLLEGEFKNIYNIDVGRGCPFNCKYCSTKTFWKKKYRLKSIERIVEEIQYMIDNYNITNFGFEHDMFTFNREYIFKFCNTLIDKKLNIMWGCSSRIDMLDEELIAKMSEAGCRNIYLGIETGSQRMQNIVNKRYKVENIYPIVALLKKHNITPTTSFIFGFPEETYEDINDTIDLIIKLYYMEVYLLQTHMFTVLPGTLYYNELKDKLFYSNTISDISLCDYIDIKKFEIYKNDIELFSQYLDFDIGIRKEVGGLNIYLMNCLKTLIKCFKKTYEFLSKYFKTNFDMFNQFRIFFKKEFNIDLRYQAYFDLNLDKTLNLAENFIKYLFDLFDAKDNVLVYETFKFEKDVTDFMYFSKEKKIYKSYNFDVYTYYATGNTDNLDYEPMTLLFERKDDKFDIGVSKIESVAINS